MRHDKNIPPGVNGIALGVGGHPHPYPANLTIKTRFIETMIHPANLTIKTRFIETMIHPANLIIKTRFIETMTHKHH